MRGNLHNVFFFSLKGQFIQNLEKHIFPLTCSAIDPSRWFCCGLLRFGDICCRVVCFLSGIMKLDGTQPVVLRVPPQKTVKEMSFSTNHALVTQSNPQIICALLSCRNYLSLSMYRTCIYCRVGQKAS